MRVRVRFLRLRHKIGLPLATRQLRMPDHRSRSCLAGVHRRLLILEWKPLEQRRLSPKRLMNLTRRMKSRRERHKSPPKWTATSVSASWARQATERGGSKRIEEPRKYSSSSTEPAACQRSKRDPNPPRLPAQRCSAAKAHTENFPPRRVLSSEGCFMSAFWIGFALGGVTAVVAAMLLWWAAVKLMPLLFDLIEGHRTRQL